MVNRVTKSMKKKMEMKRNSMMKKKKMLRMKSKMKMRMLKRRTLNETLIDSLKHQSMLLVLISSMFYSN